MEYQIRYVRYAESLGLSTKGAMARDRKKYPGVVMCGYILWIGKKWNEWMELTGRRRPFLKEDHEAFDAWLSKSVKAA